MPAFCKAGVEQRAWWARCRPVPGVTTSTCHGIQARIQKLKEGGAEWIARAAREIFCNHAHSAV